jgi:AAA+ superfamily predicted ATPase
MDTDMINTISKERGSRVVVHPPTLADALEYLTRVIHVRLALYFERESSYCSIADVPRPAFDSIQSAYTSFLQKYSPTVGEHIILLLALAPHLKPNFFDSVISQKLPSAGEFPQIGGIRGKQFRGFLPTGETAVFVLAGDDLEERFEIQQIFGEDHFFARDQILHVDSPEAGEPRMSGRLKLSQEYVDLFTIGKITKPRFSMEFPAQVITTEMEWDDLVLPERTLNQVRELEDWLAHGDTLLYEWGMRKRLKLGYRALFHGAPGTGKTLTASLLGKYTKREVFKVDLSMVVSKFIGETEKNLANLFNKAENKNWILFFDEADALFSKRTNVRDAHDKYANQEVAYLLQRVENYNGLVILASNLKSNIDDAFMRRFQSIIHFPIPTTAERLQIWHKAFPQAAILAEDVHLDVIARKHELTGAGIMNVAQFCCLRALARDDRVIRAEEIERGIRREFSKEGKLSG